MKIETASGAAAAVADALEDAGIDYAITGAVALAVHTVPRVTQDADVTVHVRRDDLDHLFDAVERAGCLFDRVQKARDLGVELLHRALR